MSLIQYCRPGPSLMSFAWETVGNRDEIPNVPGVKTRILKKGEILRTWRNSDGNLVQERVNLETSTEELLKIGEVPGYSTMDGVRTRLAVIS